MPTRTSAAPCRRTRPSISRSAANSPRAAPGEDQGLGLSLQVLNLLNHQYVIKVANGFNTDANRQRNVGFCSGFGAVYSAEMKTLAAINARTRRRGRRASRRAPACETSAAPACEVLQTSGNVENTIAALALKMVVMPLVRSFVPSGLSRNLDRLDPTVLQEAHPRPDRRSQCRARRFASRRPRVVRRCSRAARPAPGLPPARRAVYFSDYIQPPNATLVAYPSPEPRAGACTRNP